MKKSILLFIIAILSVCVSQISAVETSPQFVQNNDTLVVYSDVPGQAPSPKYTIRVRSAATNNEWVDVFAHYTYNRALEIPDIKMIGGPTPGGNSSTSVQHYPNATAGWSQTYGNIEMSRNQPVEVEIAAKNGFQIGGKNFFKATIHPAQKASAATIVNGKIYFTINDPVQVAIDINGQMDDYNAFINPIAKPTDGVSSYTVPLHTITMFTNPVIKKPTLNNPRIYYVEAGGNDSIAMKSRNPESYDTVYFKPGVHYIGLGLKIYPGKGVYVPGDAILYGTMNNWGVPLGGYSKVGEKIKIFGYGTLSGAKHAHPYYVKNPIDVNHKGIGIDNSLNYSILGVSIVNSPNFSVYTPSGVGGFLSFVKVIGWRANGDGLGNGDNVNDCFVRTNDDESYVRGNRKRVTYWKDNISAVFYMSAIWTTPILIEDCDVLYCRARGGGGAAWDMRADVPGGGVKPTQTIFRDIRFHDPIGNMKIFNLDACKGGTSGHTYNWIKFENISIASCSVKQSLLECSAAKWVSGSLTFDNVTFGSNVLTKSNFATYFNYNVDLNNIVFKTRLSYNITTTVNGNGGTVKGGGTYSSGAVATVLATLATGYKFLNWTENDVVVSNNLTYSFTVSQARNLMANFEPIQVVDVPVTGVTLAPTTISLVIGATGQLTATVIPSNATNKSVIWTSTDTSVATVDGNGLVTAKAAGTTTVTVRTNIGGFTKTCIISVSEPIIPVTSVAITNCPTSSLLVGATIDLSETVLPSNATDKSVLWTSSVVSVATVNANGLVTAKAAGTTIITVRTNDGSHVSTCNISVSEPIIPVTSVTINNCPTSSLLVGANIDLSEKVLPSNATDKSVLWTSSVVSVATVDANGLVTAKAAGTTTITVKSNSSNFIATCTITVIDNVVVCNLPWSDAGLTVNKTIVNKTYNPIDISCATDGVTISVSIQGVATDASDYCRVYYKVDGGVQQTLKAVTGVLAKQTFTVSGVKGNSLVIIVQASTSWTDEFYYLTNLNVSKSVIQPCTDNLPWAKANITVNNQTITNQSQGVVNTSCSSSVTITADVEGQGGLDLADYCKMTYKINGGTAQTLFDINNLAGAFAKKVFSKTVTASSVELILNAKNTFADEKYIISNIKIVSNNMLKSKSIASDAIENINSTESYILIYPNPTSSVLNIDFPTSEVTREIRVFNTVGQMLHCVQTKNSTAQINVQALNLKGVVMVQVIDGKTVTNHRVIVK